MTNQEHTIKALFDVHFHHLVLHSFRFINNYSQAEEIVQDVFVKVWQHFGNINDTKDLKAYLYKAVRNSSLNYIRHQKIQQKFIVDGAIVNEIEEPLENDAVTDEQISNRLHQSINKLPDKWKDAIVLSKFDKLKYHEIAVKMNISQKTVEKYISKALQFLREELRDLLVAVLLFLIFISDLIL